MWWCKVLKVLLHALWCLVVRPALARPAPRMYCVGLWRCEHSALPWDVVLRWKVMLRAANGGVVYLKSELKGPGHY
jgi:hypothetical protein